MPKKEAAKKSKPKTASRGAPASNAGVLLTATVAHLSHHGRRFMLKQPLAMSACQQEGVWTHEFKELGLVSYGTSYEESEAALFEDFACCWDSLVAELDKNLTEDARVLKKAIKNRVSSVVAMS